MMNCTVLNVAEKPSIAKTISDFLHQGEVSKPHSKSKYNPVFSFFRDFKGHQQAKILVTSVTGHIQEIDFDPKYKDWGRTNPVDLITKAEVLTKFSDQKTDLVENIRFFARNISDLVLWLDCDREGEAIAFEVIGIVSQVSPQARIHRARFSAATRSDIERAFLNLVKPDKGLSDVALVQRGRAGAARDRPADRSRLHQTPNPHGPRPLRKSPLRLLREVRSSSAATGLARSRRSASWWIATQRSETSGPKTSGTFRPPPQNCRTRRPKK